MQTPQRREVLVQAGNGQLEEAFGLAQVLEAVGAEVAQGDPAWELLDELARLPREEDLAAVPGGAHAGDTVDVESDVALVDEGGLAGVDPDPYPDVRSVRPGVVG